MSTNIACQNPGPPSRHWASDPVLWAVCALAALLLFTALGQRPLWQDEAETALLARTTLTHGVPVVFDDHGNVISQEERREFREDGIWRWSPWVQIYAQAAGFLAFGTNTFGARFFLTLGGFLAIVATYRLIVRRFGDVNWARLAVLLMTLSVPYLLFVRQGRYYGLSALLVALFLDAMLAAPIRRKHAVIMGVCLGLLFHSNYLMLLSFAPAVLAAVFLLYREKLTPGALAWLLGVTALFAVPGLFIYGAGKQSAMFDVIFIPENLVKYFSDVIMYMLPLPMAAALLWRYLAALIKNARLDPEDRFVCFLLLTMLFNVCILALVPQRFQRYIMHFYPICAVVLSFAVLRLARFSKPGAVILFALLALTNSVHLYPLERLKIIDRPWQNDVRMLTSLTFPLKLYLTELFCPYPDVNAKLAEFFNKNAKPGQTILAEYGDLPLQFYTPFRVIGGLQGPIDPAERPDWVVLRHDVRVNRDAVLFDAPRFARFVLDLDADYERIELPANDDTFGARPDPDFHQFVPAGDPITPLTIYKRKAATS